MVIIDNRDGSRELSYDPSLKDSCTLGTLDFGDVMLTGHGPNDTMISVGVEVKSVHDLLSSISTGRLAGHQLPGLIKDYDHAFLLIHGAARPGKDNYLEVRRRTGGWHNVRLGRKPVPWSYMEGWLLTAQLFSPVRVKWTSDFAEAAKWISVLDRWLSKPWDQHKALSVFNTSGVQAAPMGADPVEACIAKVAAALPGIGWTRGWGAAKHFDSVQEMMNAPAQEWEKIDKFGPVLSKSIHSTIRRRK